MRRPFSVQVFLVTRAEPEPSVLLLQRNARPDLDLADFWQGVSGAVEDHESFEQAAVREVMEETGVAIDNVAASGFEHWFPIKPEWRASYGPEPTAVHERVFYAQIPKASRPKLSSEHKAWQWAPLSQALRLLSFGRNAECLLSVSNHLSVVGPPGFEAGNGC